MQRRGKARMFELPAAGRHLRLQHSAELGGAIEDRKETGERKARHADDKFFQHAFDAGHHVAEDDCL